MALKEPGNTTRCGRCRVANSIAASPGWRAGRYMAVTSPCCGPKTSASSCGINSKQPQCAPKKITPLPCAKACVAKASPCSLTWMCGCCSSGGWCGRSHNLGSSVTNRPASAIAGLANLKSRPACSTFERNRARYFGSMAHTSQPNAAPVKCNRANGQTEKNRKIKSISRCKNARVRSHIIEASLSYLNNLQSDVKPNC